MKVWRLPATAEALGTGAADEARVVEATAEEEGLTEEDDGLMTEVEVVGRAEELETGLGADEDETTRLEEELEIGRAEDEAGRAVDEMADEVTLTEPELTGAEDRMVELL